ncbi:MAG: DUF4358 domain-containing protein [Clostridium sp.]|nr:DUF4358 domain-containing protein [Acetatifactor muris]MCM1527776.1 DUF4358 domain-containing protein [Bacteroides sp.]MCM1563871.1 DUF4358 domain-containing protein [Clostridium sp.]
MRKRMLCLCAGVLALMFAACGSRGDMGSPAESGTGESAAAQESGNSQGTGVSSESSSAQAGSGETSAEGEIFSGWSEEMASLRAAVTDELGDAYWPDMAIPAELLEMSYGLTPDMYEDYMGEMPMLSMNVDTLLIVKAAEGQADAVEKALKDYHDNYVENNRPYPMNLGKVQASMVERMDDYVCFVLLGGDVSDVEEQGDEAVIVHCREQNQRVIEIIREQLNL